MPMAPAPKTHTFIRSSSCGELAHDLIDVHQGDAAHLIRLQVADGMRQLDPGMAFHAFAPELEEAGALEGFRDDNRSRDAAFLELDGVVHTAQRAGASSADSRDRDLHLVRDAVYQTRSRGLRIVLLAPQHHACDAVALAQRLADGLEDQPALFLRV